jgi:hypothetical protein
MNGPVGMIHPSSSSATAVSSSRPFAEVPAGPVYCQEALLCADIDLSDTIPGKYDLDVVGHDVRPDVFGLHVETRKQTPVRLGEECKSDARDE